jgi:uncharacterized protein (TIGR00290 family)
VSNHAAHHRDAAAPVPTVLSWSGGKDSALALHVLLRDPNVEVRGLLTTITHGYDRVSMHGVRTELVTAQAQALGLPLWMVHIPSSATNAQYEQATREQLERLRESGIDHVAFGDLHLADVRAYRERVVGDAKLRSLFPLWGRPTARLAKDFIRDGFRAVLVCVDPRQIDVSHCGTEFDVALLDALPPAADACGEYGEFHTFVYDAPMFDRPIAIQRGVVVDRDGFVFCDLLPSDAASATSW